MAPPLEYKSHLALPLTKERDWGLFIVSMVLALGVIVLPAIYLLARALLTEGGTYLVPVLLGVLSVVVALVALTVGSALARRK